MTILLTTILVIACFIVLISVMLQPAKGGTSAFGGSSQSLFGSTGATSFLFKLTMWSAVAIMVSSLTLSTIRIRQTKKSVIDLTPSAPPTSGTPSAGEAAPRGEQVPPVAQPPVPTPTPPAPNKQ